MNLKNSSHLRNRKDIDDVLAMQNDGFLTIASGVSYDALRSLSIEIVRLYLLRSTQRMPNDTWREPSSDLGETPDLLPPGASAVA